jgi:aminoglycoside phosphotransferase (APT) family kinase protein
MTLSVGTRLGPYEIVSAIGAGGMGEVYKARDTRLDRTVAVKVLSQEFQADPTRRERFDREARAVAALNHSHICALHDVGEALSPEAEASEPVRFLVMEYLEGQTLAEGLLRGPLSPADVVKYAIEIAEALDHAHRRGLIHRDLKPANVMPRPGVLVRVFCRPLMREALRRWGCRPDDGAAACRVHPVVCHDARRSQGRREHSGLHFKVFDFLEGMSRVVDPAASV